MVESTSLSKGVMEASVSLSVSVFSVTCILLFHPHSIVSGNIIQSGDVLFNCGSKLNSTSLDGRGWTGELASMSISGQSTTSVVAATSFIGAYPVPYITSRISSSPFHFTFHLTPGQKFIRLHFYPALYSGFDKSLDRFTVIVGPFILLLDFSPTQSSSSSKFIVKEFCLNVEQHGKLRILFSPSKSHMTYAFVNGIEVVSMPTGLYYTPDGDAGASVVGQNNRFYGIDNRTALGMVERLNVGGGYVSPAEDYCRYWNADAAYFHVSGAAWKTSTQQLKSFTWKIPITLGFGYLVRLHFCDRDAAAVVNGEQNEFSILIDSQIAEMRADVMRWSGGTGFPVHKDYVIMMKGDKEGTKSDLMIGLQSINGRSLRFLKGIEIFRLSNLQNSLATSSYSPAVLKKVSTNWNLKVVRSLFSLFSLSSVVGNGMLVIILIVNAAVYSLRRISEENHQNNVNDAAVKPSNRCFSLADIRSATQDFSDAFMIGSGGYGKVYKGLICGFPDTVAIKRLSSGSKQGNREFRAEIESLSKLRHLNLVSLIGYCSEDKEMILVYEYISGGTLDDNLGKNAIKGKDYTFLNWEARLKICIDVARGLEYLHTGSNPGIIHRDVKGTNILLDDKLGAKISDFGLSKHEESESHISTHFKGTRGYLDPHYISTRRSTKKSDVYSFGVVMLVVLSGTGSGSVGPEFTGTGKPEDPEFLVARLKDCISVEEFDRIVDVEISNSISAASLKEFVKCVEKCLQQFPENRPSMAHLVVSLEHVLQLQKEPVQHIESGEISQVPEPEEPMEEIVTRKEVPNPNRGIVCAPFPNFPWMNSGTARNEKLKDLALVMPNQSNGSASTSQSKPPLPWISRWLPLTTGKWLLPVDYRAILSRSPDGLALLDSSMPKKRLYHHLCDNVILIDNRTMSFTLDKATGKKNFMISARRLYIVWGDVAEYWKFIPLATSRFNLVASLVAVCWLEIFGFINSKMMSPNTKYTFNLVFAVTSKFNWVNYPTELSVGFNGQQWQTKFVLFDPNNGSGVLRTAKNMKEALVRTQTVRQRNDGWLEIELGEIYIKEGEDKDIVVRVAEVESNHWKHGLVIEGIEIRAKME